MQRGQIAAGRQRRGSYRRIVIDHRAHDRQVAVGVNQLDRARLAGPVDHSAGSDLPEAASRVGWIPPRSDGVRVGVPIQPEHDIPEPVQQRHYLSGAKQRQPVRARMRPGVGQRVDTVVREHDHQPVIITGPDPFSRSVSKDRMRLDQPILKPAGLVVVQASVGPARLASGVQRDHPHRWCVVNVVGGPVAAVLLAEAVPGRPGAGPEMRRDELLAGDWPALGIRDYRPDWSGHEYVRPVGKRLKRPVMIEAVGQRGWLDPADERGGQFRRHQPDTLIERLVIAETGQPWHRQAAGGEVADRQIKQTGMIRKAERAPEDVRAIRAGAVWLPEDVVGPVQRLHARIAPVRAEGHDAAIEEGQERLQLVPVRVVNRVSGRHREGGRQTSGRTAHGVYSPQGGVDRMRGQRLLRTLHRDDLGVPGIGEEPVKELEPGR
jgi:hypothetical protein